MNISSQKLELMTAWAQTASLKELVTELRKTSKLDAYEESNMEAVSMLSETIVTRFSK